MSQSIHFLGLDVHKESIRVSIAPSDSLEVRHYGQIGGTLDDVDRLIKKLSAAAPRAERRLAAGSKDGFEKLHRMKNRNANGCALDRI